MDPPTRRDGGTSTTAEELEYEELQFENEDYNDPVSDIMTQGYVVQATAPTTVKKGKAWLRKHSAAHSSRPLHSFTLLDDGCKQFEKLVEEPDYQPTNRESYKKQIDVIKA